MSYDWVVPTDVVGTRPTIQLKMDSVVEALPFPVLCEGCGAVMRFKPTHGGYYRYRHPKLNGRCPIGICYTIDPDFVARVAYRVATERRGGLDTDTVLDRLAEVARVLTRSTHTEFFASVILKPRQPPADATPGCHGNNALPLHHNPN